MTIPVVTTDRGRFHIAIGGCSFYTQYASIYLSRLKIAHCRLENQARRRWPELPIRSVPDVKVDEECIIIGTIFRSSAQKPSIMRQLTLLEQVGGRLELEEQERQHYLTRIASSDDEMFLEDEVQRITLVASPHTDALDRLPTGVVTCLRGFEPARSEGTFTVLELAFLEPQPMRPIAAANVDSPCPPLLNSSGRWVGFVSGLGFAASAEVANNGTSHGHALALRLLGDWLRKMPLCRLFVLGDCIRSTDPGGLETLGVVQHARFLSRRADADSVMAMGMFDAWLSELPLGGGGGGGGFSVELLPGVADCVSQLLPQQPFHPLLFPRTTSRFGRGEGALVSSTNPCYSEVHSRRILATSGQNVIDVHKYTIVGDTLDCMESLLHWGHIAPTCPDTLFAYPQMDTDTLLFSVDPKTGVSIDYPDIFVAGNQQAAQFRRASLELWNVSEGERKGALLIAVPRFDVSYTMVLLELETLRCVPLRFDLSRTE
ncbi:DNA polymerase delta subunit 2 [Echinococcus granulosus]|uniref:DNA polymerase delta subunit 2 n=1 Tax=Echinococcus granulosus TaxID=6210 RepID=W6U9Y7_ECHGR|nr:DNA polymerase delta subunit 2 [Echinococcus granulosus]EUB57850.1 DNA polymerase delta subunit 2 [Echinococcus granulosus]